MPSPRLAAALALALAAADARADLVPFGKKVVQHRLRVEGVERLNDHVFAVFDCYQPDLLDYCVLVAPGDYNAGSRAGLYALPRKGTKTEAAKTLAPDGGIASAVDAGVAIVDPPVGALSGEDFFRKGHPKLIGPFALASYSSYQNVRVRVRLVTDVLQIEGVSGKTIEAKYVRVAFTCADGRQVELPWDGQGERPPQPCGEDDPPPPPASASAAPAPSASAAPAAPSEGEPVSQAALWGIAAVMLVLGVVTLASSKKR